MPECLGCIATMYKPLFLWLLASVFGFPPSFLCSLFSPLVTSPCLILSPCLQLLPWSAEKRTFGASAPLWGYEGTTMGWHVRCFIARRLSWEFGSALSPLVAESGCCVPCFVLFLFSCCFSRCLRSVFCVSFPSSFRVFASLQLCRVLISATWFTWVWSDVRPHVS